MKLKSWQWMAAVGGALLAMDIMIIICGSLI